MSYVASTESSASEKDRVAVAPFLTVIADNVGSVKVAATHGSVTVIEKDSASEV